MLKLQMLSWVAAAALLAACGDDSVPAGGETGSSGSVAEDGSGSTSEPMPSDSSGSGGDDADSSSGDDDSSTGEPGDSGSDSTGPAPGVCGDGVIDDGEECDDGPANANTAACKADCTLQFCPDGFVGPGEECDDGDGTNWNECTNTCELPFCGDDLTSIGEECDDGNADDTDDCLSTCVDATCGDMFVWAGMEECDDGNADDADACLSTCVAAFCGDGEIWDGMETCDDGNQVDTDACPTSCVPAFCGDTFIQSGVETCDDGNMIDTDACLASCQPASCGDGVIWAGVETCEDMNADDTDDCPSTCQSAFCGDGFVWAGMETCDDGNLDDTDACPTSCVPAFCGDGFIEAMNETCDDANADNTDDCLDDCTVAFCGDGFVHATDEVCDDGNMEDGDGCESDCTITPDPCGPPGQVIYVDIDATGANDGSSWADAYDSVLSAMQAAGQNDELWIAEGTYLPIAANAPVVTLSSCVDIFGGFVGTESAVDERPAVLPATVFDGDFAQDDAAALFGDNSTHVMVADGVQNVIVDGVEVARGRASGFGVDGIGAGAILLSSSVSFHGVTFVANFNGGIHASDSTVTVDASLFEANTGRGFTSEQTSATITNSDFIANVGGALALNDGSLLLQTSHVEGNTTTGIAGGLYMSNTPALVQSTAFLSNTSDSEGGAIYATGDANVEISECDLENNYAAFRGGAMYMEAPGTTSDTSFVNNSTDQFGGALYREAENGVHTFVDCSFVGNQALAGSGQDTGGAVYIDDGLTNFVGSTFADNVASELGGAIRIYQSPDEVVVDNCEFLANTATDGGAIYITPTGTLGHLTVVASRFVDNVASDGGGGAIFIFDTGFSTDYELDIVSSHFEGNTSTENGGAVATGYAAVIANSTFSGNSCGLVGAGARVEDGDETRVTDCSFYNNMAGGSGGGLALFPGGGTTIVRNSVFWGNSEDMTGEGLATISNVCSEEFLAIGGANVLSLADPFAVGPSGELFLDQASVCVDVGDDVAATADYSAIGLDWQVLTTDINGVLDATPVDPGAHYEP